VKGYTGVVVRSVTTSSLLDRIALDHGLETVVTPVGFKYLGAEMLEGNVILAGEESGGLSITDHIPEKDGILACLLAAEMVCAGGRGLAAQLDDLWKMYGRVYVTRVDLQLDDYLRD
ncbi:MAG: phosphoglucomutase/phosphomannomutase family protein, partial [Candidatus Aegiribacteria sp.]|nr:phosphoglucomutase/phosphomannomutase family protein [Candidatus Aegiribacteria sp.]